MHYYVSNLISRTSPHISPHLPPGDALLRLQPHLAHISPYLPTSPSRRCTTTSPTSSRAHLPISPHISLQAMHYYVSNLISRTSPHISPHLPPGDALLRLQPHLAHISLPYLPTSPSRRCTTTSPT